ncbi:MAG: carboxypeptidase regulatory-like domain-containing protein [Bacteroidetes bacterium]|nr:carboxypeptidase regulatory-like domain-containing protein [Bacteroidota bacterium]
MATLRVGALIILFLLLINPRFERVQTIESTPTVSLLIDDTQSIGIEKNNWNGLNDMQSVLSSVEQSLSELNIAMRWRSFYRNSEAVDSFESLQFDKSGTDINRVLTEYDQISDSDIFILVTDGISTTGRDPAFAGRMMNRPVFTVAVGDTALQRDIVLQRVDYPRNAFINASTSISAVIRNDGYKDEAISVILRSGSDVIDQKEIQTSSERSTHQVEFTVESDVDGLKSFTIETLPLDGEWSLVNNTRNFSINFMDDVTRILYLAYEIHPDVGAFRNILQTNPSVLVTPRTWITDDRFVEGILPSRTDTFDVVIVHGLPDSQNAQNRLKNMVEQNSVFFLLSPMVSSAEWTEVTNRILGRPSLRVDRGVQNVQIRPSNDQSGHSILSLPPLEFSRTPALQSPVAGINESPSGTNILYATFRGEPTTTPLLTITQTGNNRNAFLLAYGLQQWFLQGDDDQRSWLDALLTNITNWVAADIQDELFEISTILPEFDSGEPVLFVADVRDESGNPESNAQIDLTVISEEAGVNRSFTMQSSGRGRYNLDIGAVPEGVYLFEAEARVGAQFLGAQSGSFQVGNSAIEFINTQRNDDALRQIAQGSGGSFFIYDDLQNFADSVNEILELRSSTEQRIPGYVNRSPLWFIVLILFLAAEWLYRKKLSLP